MGMPQGERVYRGRRRPAAAFFFGLLVFAGIFSVAISAGQSEPQAKSSTPDLKSFVGTWKASFQGEVFAILVLKEKDGELTGTLNNFDLVVNKEGTLLEGTHKNLGDAALLNPHFKSGALVFVVMQKDQYYPSTEFTFAPTNGQDGELTPSANNPPYANNDATVKPISMVRDRVKP
jgi:hypothetical protein